MRTERWLVTALLAGVVTAGACSSPSDGGRAAPGDEVATSASTAQPSGTPDTVAPGSPTPTPADGAGPPATPSTTGPPPSTDGRAPSASPAPAPGAVGAYAPFYLRPAESSRIVLEIRSQAGAEPREATIRHLEEVLRSVSGKEVVLSGGSVAGGGKQWTSGDIRSAADTSTVPQSRDGAVLRILFLRGGFAESDTVLGIAVRSDVAAIFSDRVDEAAGLFTGAARVEDAVSVHEAGHLLGLVDLFLSTGRQDPEHPGHSTNAGSVMYYAVESTLVGSILSGGPPTDFDDRDRADLSAIRNG